MQMVPEGKASLPPTVTEGDTQKRSVVSVSGIEFRPHARKDLRPHKLLGMGARGGGAWGVSV